MLEKVPNRKSPCKDKNCNFCCNPVKIDKRLIDRGLILPKDEYGNDLFIERNEYLIPEKNIDTVKLKTFDCRNFDKETGLCKDYENRPNICRNTSCINNSEKSIDEQYSELVDTKFIKIKR